MNRQQRHSFNGWRFDELLVKYPGLRLTPVQESGQTVVGTLAFVADVAELEFIADEYEVRMSFPKLRDDIPSAWETGGRIPPTFHQQPDRSLCLGSPTRLRFILGQSATALEFVEKCVIPYLYGYSYFESHGALPFGELKHGDDGINQDLAFLYGTIGARAIRDFVRLTAMKKRHANKEDCPCGSRRRLGKCHNGRVNALRSRLGRKWFRLCHQQLNYRR